MSNILLTFGDSWPAGARLNDKSLAFPTLISNELGMDLLDLSEPATSIDHAVMAFFKFLENTYDSDNQYTALFCLTDPSRNMAWRPITSVPVRDAIWDHDSTTVELQIGNTFDELSQVYFKNIHSARLELFTYHKNVILLKLLCEKYNIRDFYAHNFYNPEFEFRVVNTDNVYPTTLRQILDCTPYKEFLPIQTSPEKIEQAHKAKLMNNKLMLFGGHPSEAGHKRIADVLSDWIKNSGR